MKALPLLLACAAVVGCSDNTGPGAPRPVDSVHIRLSVSQTCVSGSCVPEPPGWTLYTATIVNTGPGTAYLARCGASPALEIQFYQHGTWVTFEPPGVPCGDSPSPSIALAPRDSLHVDVTLQEGPTRVILDVGTLPDLSDAKLDASEAVMMFP